MAVEGACRSAEGRSFEQWWQRHGEWVEAPNHRRGGESGVQRLLHADGSLLYAKRQVGHIYRSLRHPWGRPTVLRERDALHGLSALGVRVPRPVYCGSRRRAEGGWHALLVSEALEGFVDLPSWYADGGRARCGEAVHAELLRLIGATLARMHNGRWQHGCLYEKHLFIKVIGAGEGGATTVEVALLDLEKSRRRLSRTRAALHDLRQLRRHSSWNDTDWDTMIYGYQAVFGSTIKGLQT
ncbi:lipopolysaccharide kinase InaA family protein [Pseudomonas mangiferae]|uniref:InaA protein n=1 Tax=Pseudomonas mangiferae TaxID=2593654 RepID=A0A553H3L2_9PSED|nr:lipopolysaccharide kinase InaA family protein [Pseudomonas mangiferae]TRX76318.1 InaA protein [Pseudomonas mangiferae]